MSEHDNDVSGGVIHTDDPTGAEKEKLRQELIELRAQIEQEKQSKADAPDPEDGGDELAIQREVRKGYSKAELEGQTVMVPPLQKWKSSAMKALNAGDFETWAERTLDDEGWEVWVEVDPSLDQIDAFFESFSADLGVDRGNSRSSRRSSRSTTRR